MRGKVGPVHRGEDFLRRRAVVVGGAAHKAEAGQRDHRIDCGLAVLHEEFLDRWARIERGGEGGDDVQAPRLERGDHAVIVCGIVGEHVGAQQQQADGAVGARARERGGVLGHAAGQAGVIDAEFGIFDDGCRLERALPRGAVAGGVTVHQIADHRFEILVAARQPILQRHEIGTHVLRRAGDEFEQLGQLLE